MGNAPLYVGALHILTTHCYTIDNRQWILWIRYVLPFRVSWDAHFRLELPNVTAHLRGHVLVFKNKMEES